MAFLDYEFLLQLGVFGISKKIGGNDGVFFFFFPGLMQHCSGVNCLILPGVDAPGGGGDGGHYLFSGSRDGTLKRWELGNEGAVCGVTFESHVDWV